MPKGKDVLKKEVISKHGLDPETQGELIDSIVEDRFKDEEFKANEKNRTEKLRKENKNLFNAKEFYKDPKNQKPKSKEDPKGDKNKPNGENDERYVTKDEFERQSHRQRFPHLTDEEYNYIDALAKTDKRSFEETIEKNPVASTYLQNIDIEKRLAGATKSPGTRIASGESKTEDDKIADELSTDLPRGYSVPKSK